MLFTPFGPIKVFVDGIELDYEGSFLLMKMPFQLIRRKIVLKILLRAERVTFPLIPKHASKIYTR